MIKDGKAFLTKAGKKPRQTLNDVLDDGKAKIEDLSEDTRSRMAELKADTRSVLEGIGNDARLVVDEVVYGGRQTVALGIAKGAHGVAQRAKRLNKKLEAFHRTVAA